MIFHKKLLNINQLLELPLTRKILKCPLLLLGVILSTIVLFCLWLLSPFIHIKVGGLVGQRIGHLALNTDLFFRKQQLSKDNREFTQVFIVGRVVNRQLLTMWKRHAIIIESRFLRGLFEYSTWLWSKTKFYEPLEMLSNEYYEFNAAKPTLFFTKIEEEKGRGFLEKLGIDLNRDWFVCLFARDPLYLQKEFGLQKDWSYHDYRNSDIDIFKLAIDYIIKQGGFVIRMGWHVAKSLNYNHPKVIDYAISSRTDFMDIFLSAKCRFVLGNNAGITDVPVIFDRPKAAVNVTPPTNAPIGKDSIFIPKKIVKSDGEYVLYTEYIKETINPDNDLEFNPIGFASKDWKYESCTSQEVLDLVIEIIDRLESRYIPTDEDVYLLTEYYKAYPIEHWAERIKTPIGIAFLRRYKHLYGINSSNVSLLYNEEFV